MRKNYLLSIFLFAGALSLLASCTKEKAQNVYVEPYIVKGIVDLQWKKNFFGYGGGNLPLTIEYLNSSQDYLNLSLEGVPAGIGYTIMPAGGYAPFSTNISFNDSAAAPGTYAVKLKCKGATTGEKSYNINVTVLSSPNIVDAILGSYTFGNSSCFFLSSSFQHTVTRKGTSDTVIVNNFFNTGTNLDLVVNRPTGNLLIYKQNLIANGVTWEVTGTGSVGSSGLQTINSIYLNLMMKDVLSSNTTTCSATLYR